MNERPRPTFEEIYLSLAFSLAERSTCKRLRVGTVITSTDYRKVLAVGYNGNASGLPNRCDRDEAELLSGNWATGVDLLARFAGDVPFLVPIFPCGDIETAVETGLKIGTKGDVLLLSPACASFDQFLDFEDRGRRFKSLVAAAAKKK